MTEKTDYGFFSALKASLSAVSPVIASAGTIPADAAEGSLFLSTEKITYADNGECTAFYKIRYFSPRMIPGDDGAVLSALSRVAAGGKEIRLQKYESRHCGRYFDVSAVYSVPSLFFEYGSEGDASRVMRSAITNITFG